MVWVHWAVIYTGNIMESTEFSGWVVSDCGDVIFKQVSGYFIIPDSNVRVGMFGVMEIESGEMPLHFVGWLVLDNGTKVRASSLNDRKPMSIRCSGDPIDADL